MSALRSILASFDIQVHSEQLDAGSSKIDRVIGQLGALGVAFMAFRAIKGFAHWGEEVAKSAREIEFHAGRMEMDTDAYQKLSQVAENFGMTMENLQIANTLFTRALGNAGGVMGVLGGHSRHAAAAFKSLGLSAAQFKGQKLEDILPVISDAMLKIEDPMERVTAGLNLFGHRGRSIMPMMAQGGDAIRRAFAAAVPIFEKATIEAANKATISGKQLSRVWDNLVTNSVGQAAMLMFSKLANRLMDIVMVMKDLSRNSEIGKGILIALGAAGVAVAGWLLVAFAPVLVPLLAIIAAASLLALIIDDFLVFMKGGHSVIGEFFNEFLGPGGAQAARAWIKDIWEQFKGWIADIKATVLPKFLDDLRQKLEDIHKAIEEIKAAWAVLSGIANFIANKTGLTDENIKKWTGIGPGAPADQPGGARSPFARLGNIAGPPELSGTMSTEVEHRPTEAQAGKGITFNMIGTIDPTELAGRLKRQLDLSNEAAVNKILRDTAGAGGGADSDYSP